MERRFCSYTFVPEEEIGNGRLLRCSRCKDTYYRDHEAQKAHWRLHKKVCKPLDVAERQRIYAFDSQEVAVALISLFKTPWESAGRQFLYLLKRLEELCAQAAEEGGEPLSSLFEDQDIVNEGCSDIRKSPLFMAIFSLISKVNNTMVELLWAIPGVTNYILGHSLTSEYMQKEKQAKGMLPSCWEYSCPGYDRLFHLHPVFCNVMGIFVSISAMVTKRGDGGEAFSRGTPLAAAAASRCMRWWSNPYSRASIPRRCNCAFTPRKVWFHMVFRGTLHSDAKAFSEYINPNELIPGLTVKEAFFIITEEDFYAQFTVPEKFYPLFDFFACTTNSRSAAWGAFSVSDRALVARAVANRYGFSSREEFVEERIIDCAQRLQVMAMSWENDTCLWLKVIKVACQLQPVDQAVVFFQEWLDLVLDEFKPAAQLLVELVKEKDPDTPDIPNDVMRSICEFVLPDNLDDLPEDYSNWRNHGRL